RAVPGGSPRSWVDYAGAGAPGKPVRRRLCRGVDQTPDFLEMRVATVIRVGYLPAGHGTGPVQQQRDLVPGVRRGQLAHVVQVLGVGAQQPVEILEVSAAQLAG